MTEHVHIEAAGLDASSAPIRICHLSDLHARPWEPRYASLVDDIDVLNPDIILITGDSVQKHEGAWEHARDFLAGLRARQGVFACRGNWEIKHAGPSVSAARDLFASAGVHLLVNESRTLEFAAGTIRLAGVDDIVCGWPDFRATLRADDAPYTVLMSHAPMAADLVPAGLRADLVLSGHTHGGQIRLPLVWRRMLPRCSGRFADGLYELDERNVYVNRGFGMVGYVNARFRCPAELTMIELQGAGTPTTGPSASAQ